MEHCHCRDNVAFDEGKSKCGLTEFQHTNDRLLAILCSKKPVGMSPLIRCNGGRRALVLDHMAEVLVLKQDCHQRLYGLTCAVLPPDTVHDDW